MNKRIKIAICSRVKTQSQLDMAKRVYSRGKEVVLVELQVVIVAKPAQDGPGGLMPASLDEERVKEQEAW